MSHRIFTFLLLVALACAAWIPGGSDAFSKRGKGPKGPDDEDARISSARFVAPARG